MKEVILKEHNVKTFENVCKLFETENRVAVEQATGTGKSYITASAISCFSNTKTLYMTSGREIIKEFKESEDLNQMVDMDKIEFITYQKALTIDVELLRGKYDFIVLDEYHRCGAEKWFKAVMNILDTLLEAKVLGTTATPIRYLDGGRNMSEEIFNNVVANTITLPSAISENILVKPKYIVGVYDYNMNKRLERYSNKDEILKKLKFLTNNFDSLCGVSNILKKHITSERKFLIFCESIYHLNEMKNTVFKWFKNAFKDEEINIYSMYSTNKENVIEFENFKKADSGFNLLFVVNMFNEGIHIDVDGLIFLRGTRSAIIYYQQLGRALTSSNKKVPLIFDLVKNNQNILDLNYNDGEKNSYLVKNNLSERDFDYSIGGYFDVIDESIDFKKAITDIELHISGWMDKYKMLADFKAKNGNIDIHSSNEVLYRFLLLQKKKYYYNKLEENKISLLEKLDIKWDYTGNKNESQWHSRLDEIRENVSINGYLNVPRSQTSLYKFLSKQKNLYLKGEMSEEKAKDLIDAGFRLDKLDVNKYLEQKLIIKSENKANNKIDVWDIRYDELIDFKEEFGHCNVPRNYNNKSLAEWVHTQRKNKSKLSLYKKEKLLAIGFEFDLAKQTLSKQWDIMFEKLIEYKKRFKNCNVSSRYEDKKLANWVSTQRKAFKANKLSSDRYDRLVEIGFEF